MFFVISGFIMWTLTTSRRISPAAFLIDRIKRIVPLYWLATAVLVFAGLVGIVPVTQNDLSVSSVLKSLFFIPYIAVGSTEIWPILTAGWTLNYEMFFYAVFAGFLFTAPKIRLWGLTGTFVVLIIFGAIFKPAGPVLATYTSALIGHFLAGVWIAEGVRKGFSVPLRISLLTVIAGVAALCFLPAGGALATLACGLASAAIVAGVVSMDLRGSVARVPALLLAGNASYSIYLWHGFALVVLGKAAAMLGLPAWLAIISGVVGGIVCGLVVYVALEKPGRRLLSRWNAAPAAR